MKKLSILIPTYNHDCVLLADTIVGQIEATGINAEVIVLDDGSSDMNVLAENASIESMDYCRYIVSPINHGIAVTRNQLIAEATGDYLLFMDSDTYPTDDDFLSKYADAANDADVIVGGILYRTGEETIVNPLRLKYGIHKECKSVEKRNSRPHATFLSSCFLMSREAAEKVHFDEDFDRYGHEDTLFGIALEKAGLKVLHIDAPVYHDNTSTSEQYLSNVRIAIQSLSMHADKLRGYSRLLWLYDILDQFHLTGFAYSVLGRFRSAMEKNLTGKHPLLCVLMLYKTYYLCGVMKL